MQYLWQKQLIIYITSLSHSAEPLQSCSLIEAGSIVFLLYRQPIYCMHLNITIGMSEPVIQLLPETNPQIVRVITIPNTLQEALLAHPR